MEKKEKIANLSFCYDRLWERKLAQVYRLLVPPSGSEPTADACQKRIETTRYENSGYLHTSVLRRTEGE